MQVVYIIIYGRSISHSDGFKDVWQSSSKINSYYESKRNAELYLFNNGYERDHDGVYFLMDAEDDDQVVAKIIQLSKM